MPDSFKKLFNTLNHIELIFSDKMVLFIFLYDFK